MSSHTALPSHQAFAVELGQAHHRIEHGEVNLNQAEADVRRE